MWFATTPARDGGNGPDFCRPAADIAPQHPYKFVIVAPMGRMTSTGLYLRLLQYVKPYWRVFALALVGMVIVALTEVALPALLKPLLDGTFVHKDPVLMRWIPLVVLGLTAVRGCAEYAASYSVNWVGSKLVTDLRVEMFGRMLTFPTLSYD